MTSLTVPKGLQEITPFWFTEALHSKRGLEQRFRDPALG